jgi:hypothetical protein
MAELSFFVMTGLAFRHGQARYSVMAGLVPAIHVFLADAPHR